MPNLPPKPPEPVYTLRAPRIIGGRNRVGEECRIVTRTSSRVHVRFEDGAEAVLPKMVVRQKPTNSGH
jgi:hypothetical protein